MPFCCVPHCNRKQFKYGKDGRKKRILCHSFSMPKDKEEFNIWCKQIKRKDRALSRKDRICSLHFEPDCLIKYFEVHRPDGSFERVKRSRYGLRSGAIPTRFPRKSKLYFKSLDRERSLRHCDGELNTRSSDYNDDSNLVTRIKGDANDDVSPCSDDAKIEPISNDDNIEFFPVDPFSVGSSSSNVDKFTEIFEFVRRKKEILNWSFFVDKLGASFFQYNSSCLFKKRVLFLRESQKPKILINDEEVDVNMEIKNGRDLQRLLSMVNDEKSYPLVIK